MMTTKLLFVEVSTKRQSSRRVCQVLICLLLKVAVAVCLTGAAHAESSMGWQLCSERLASESTIELTAEQRRHCVIAVAGTYLQWVRGDLAAADLPLAKDFVRRVMGTSRNDATTDRAALLVDRRPGLIASAIEQEWFVEGDTAWAIFIVRLKSSPEDSNWIAERFTVTDGRISDIMALPPVLKR